MKLRLRSLESKETLKIEVPDPCTLQQLRDIVVRTLSSSSSVSTASLHLSLNRKDEVQESSPEESLHSLGITSGDLVFYTFKPLASSSQEDTPIEAFEITIPGVSVRGSSPPQPPVSDSNLEKLRLDKCHEVEHPRSIEPDYVGADVITGYGVCEGEEKLGSDGVEMDIDESIETVVENKCSKPTFLRRVLKEEIGDDRNAHKLLVTAVHAVLLESGFVLIDPNSGTTDTSFYLPGDWPSPSFTMSLWYTLPELLVKNHDSSIMNGVVLLKFQSLGQFVNVYGSLGCGKGTCVYRVSLDEKQFSPNLDLIWANSESNNIMDEIERYDERQVFEFWKIVKDALALPLLIDLCDKTGLPPPANFMRLPGDLKLKILEALPGVDIARLECVCTELRYLASSNDLWKLKCDEEFDINEISQGNKQCQWKVRYMSFFEVKKLCNRDTLEITRRRGPNFGLGWPYRPAIMRRQHRPPPFVVPRVIGGDYDIGPRTAFPHIGLPNLRHAPSHHMHSNCNLGGI